MLPANVDKLSIQRHSVGSDRLRPVAVAFGAAVFRKCGREPVFVQRSFMQLSDTLPGNVTFRRCTNYTNDWSSFRMGRSCAITREASG